MFVMANLKNNSTTIFCLHSFYFFAIFLLIASLSEGIPIVGSEKENFGRGIDEIGSEHVSIEEQQFPNGSPFKTMLGNGKTDEESATSSSSLISKNLQDSHSSTSPEWETVLDPKVYIITEYDQTNPNVINSHKQEVHSMNGRREEDGYAGGRLDVPLLDALAFHEEPEEDNYLTQKLENPPEILPIFRERRNSLSVGGGVGGNGGGSLSIVNPLDVLRQRLLLEIARRRNLKQNQHQIIANAELLKNIG